MLRSSRLEGQPQAESTQRDMEERCPEMGWWGENQDERDRHPRNRDLEKEREEGDTARATEKEKQTEKKA